MQEMCIIIYFFKIFQTQKCLEVIWNFHKKTTPKTGFDFLKMQHIRSKISFRRTMSFYFRLTTLINQLLIFVVVAKSMVHQLNIKSIVRKSLYQYHTMGLHEVILS